MSIPAEYRDDERLEEAYHLGWHNGRDFARYNLPVAGKPVLTDSYGEVTPVTLDECRDVHSSLCHDAETNSRDYSPFEFLAHEFNCAGDDEEEQDWLPDALWEAYDAGIADRIAADVVKYGPEDYGIEESEHE